VKKSQLNQEENEEKENSSLFQSIQMVSKVDTFCIFVLFAVALAAAGTIRSEYSPNGGIQWLLV